MKRKVGIVLNSLPLGVIFVLLEYDGIISSFLMRYPSSGQGNIIKFLKNYLPIFGR